MEDNSYFVMSLTGYGEQNYELLRAYELRNRRTESRLRQGSVLI